MSENGILRGEKGVPPRRSSKGRIILNSAFLRGKKGRMAGRYLNHDRLHAAATSAVTREAFALTNGTVANTSSGALGKFQLS